MTLLLFDGFDNAATVPKPEWDSGTAWLGQTGRDSTTNGSVSTSTSASVKLLTLPSAAATLVMGLAVSPRVTGAFGGTVTSTIGFRTGALTTDGVHLNFDATGRLLLRTGGAAGTILATGAYSFPVGAWTQLQVKLTSSSTALACTVYVNGSSTPDLTYSGAAASSQTAAITKVSLGNANGSGSQAMFYDDLWVCDTVDATATQGRSFNDMLGDLKVSTLLPTGAGASTQWTPTAGANYTTVAENPPNQTDYVSAATTGLRDLYDTADLSASATTVYGLRVGAYVQKSDAGAANVKPLLRESNGTLDGAATVALGTAWGPAYGTLVTRKGDSTLWSVADVNAAQVGIESA